MSDVGNLSGGANDGGEAAPSLTIGMLSTMVITMIMGAAGRANALARFGKAVQSDATETQEFQNRRRDPAGRHQRVQRLLARSG